MKRTSFCCCYRIFEWFCLPVFVLNIYQLIYIKKGKRKVSPGSATVTNRSPSQSPRGRGNRQIQTSTNQTNVRKTLRLALSSPNEVIAMLKGLKNTRTKWHKIRHKTIIALLFSVQKAPFSRYFFLLCVVYFVETYSINILIICYIHKLTNHKFISEMVLNEGDFYFYVCLIYM